MIFDLPDVTKCLTVCYLCNAIIQYSTTRDQMYHQNDGCFINLTSDFKIRFINDNRNYPLNDPGALGNQFMQISHHTARNQSIFAFGLHSPCLMSLNFQKRCLHFVTIQKRDLSSRSSGDVNIGYLSGSKPSKSTCGLHDFRTMTPKYRDVEDGSIQK